MAKKSIKLKILIVTQYFYPESFRINDVAKYLKSLGYQVDVLTGYPDYPNKKIFKNYHKSKYLYSNHTKSRVYRLPVISRGSGHPIRLFLNYFTFVLMGLLLSKKILKNNTYDIVFTFGTSPITVALVAMYISKIKKAKSALWLLDLWPEILLDIKTINKKIIFHLGKFLSKKIYDSMDCILVQSMSFKKEISKYTDKKKIIYFPAWAEELKKIKIKKKKLNVFTIVFTGNIGEVQNFNNILLAANILKKEKIKWLIIGSGRFLYKVKDFINQNKIKNFYLLGHKLQNKISYYHQLSDILILPLKGTKYISKTIPGKLQTYLQANKYILGFCKGESAKLIVKSKSGSVVNPDRPDLLVKKILLLMNKKEIIKKREKEIDTRKYVNKFFNKEKLLDFLDKKVLRPLS